MRATLTALTLSCLLMQPAHAGVLRTTLKVVTLPIYAISGFVIGHVVGPICGTVVFVKIWDDAWTEEKTNK